MGLRLEQIERLGPEGFQRIVRVWSAEMEEDLQARALQGDDALAWLVSMGCEVLRSVNQTLDVADMAADDHPEIPLERMRGAGVSGIALGLLAIGYGIAVEEITGGGNNGS